MRNRVALKAARMAAMTSKLVLVLVLVPVALAVTAQGASATTALADSLADRDVAADSVAFGILGPVGIAAVALGFGGLVIGLLRHHRRREVSTASAAVISAATTVTMPVDASGSLPVLEVGQPVEPAAGERVG